MLTSTHQPEKLICSPTGSWELEAEVRASETRHQGEDWDWLREDSLKGASTPAGKESGKKSGPAREARDLCFRVHEERGFLPSVPTEGIAPPK